MAVNQPLVPSGGEEPPLRLVPDTPTSVPLNKKAGFFLEKCIIVLPPSDLFCCVVFAGNFEVFNFETEEV